jgi:CheY-like chemotaxis protein
VAALRRVLTDAIQSLKPDASAPLSSNAWRVYHILTYRYLEQSSQKQVANDLALSIRQLRRDEDEAFGVLAELLWTKHGMQARLQDDLSSHLHTPSAVPASSVDTGHDHKQDLDWLRDSFPGEYADVLETIHSVLGTLEPVLRDAGADIRYTLPAQPLPLVMSKPEVLRQAIINLLLAAVYRAQNMTIQIAIDSWQNQVRMLVYGQGTSMNTGTTAVNEALDMTSELLHLFGGSLTLNPSASDAFDACMLLPISSQVAVSVLVIDDHADAQQLMQRYLSGSRYQLHGCRDPEKAMEMATELGPRIIILDIMLPGTDGWELLHRLRHHPVTTRVPVIVSTFLPQEQMALTLGAAAFLRKPIIRLSLLAALDRQVESKLRESH